MRLLSLAPDDIKSLIDQLEKECADIKRQALSFSWYSRGGISYADALNLSMPERKLMSELIESNLETTKKSKLPFF